MLLDGNCFFTDRSPESALLAGDERGSCLGAVGPVAVKAKWPPGWQAAQTCPGCWSKDAWSLPWRRCGARDQTAVFSVKEPKRIEPCMYSKSTGNTIRCVQQQCFLRQNKVQLTTHCKSTGHLLHLSKQKWLVLTEQSTMNHFMSRDSCNRSKVVIHVANANTVL